MGSKRNVKMRIRYTCVFADKLKKNVLSYDMVAFWQENEHLSVKSLQNCTHLLTVDTKLQNLSFLKEQIWLFFLDNSTDWPLNEKLIL